MHHSTGRAAPMAAAVIFVFVFCLALSAQRESSRPTEAVSYAAKPTLLTSYTPPHKPHTRLTEVKAKHKGESEWSQWVVKDDTLWGQYVQSAPASKVSPRFHPDTREWWVIVEGQIRFHIEGQESFTARPRSMVQVPPQTIYSMETVGDQPAIRYEVNIPNATTLFPERPPLMTPGFEFVPVRLGRKPYPYGHENKPHINLEEIVKADPNTRGGRFVHDDRAVANIIYGYNSKLPPVNERDRGHYHPDSSESWLILLGQIRYPIEGQGVVIASEGDVVYVPKFTFHAPRWWGEGPSCRLAMNGFAGISHLREAVTPH